MQERCSKLINKDSLLEEYNDQLQTHSSKRKKELSTISALINNSLISQDVRFYIARVTMPSIYAHYEGFLKFAILKTLKLLKNLRLDISTINTSLLVFPIFISLENITTRNKRIEKLLNLIEKYNKDNSYYLVDFTSDEILIGHDDIPFFLKIFFNDLDLLLKIVNTNSKYIFMLSQCLFKSEYITNEEKEKIESLNKKRLSFKVLTLDDLSFLLDVFLKVMQKIYDRRNPIAHGEIENQNKLSLFVINDSTSSMFYKTAKYWTIHCDLIISAIDLFSFIFVEYLSNELYIKPNMEIVSA